MTRIEYVVHIEDPERAKAVAEQVRSIANGNHGEGHFFVMSDYGPYPQPEKPATPPCPVCGQACDTALGVCSKCIRNNPTRLMVTRRCDPCNNEWLSAATTGACPKCHSAEGCRTIQIRVNGLKRL